MKMQVDRSRRNLLEAVVRRRREIEVSVLVRVQGIVTDDEQRDAAYVEGIRRAVETAIDHTIRASEAIDDRSLRVPNEVLAQSRLAARRQTPLEIVLRRYQAGHSVLGDFVAEEAERQGASPALLRAVLRSLAVTTDGALAAISLTYHEEANFARPLSTDRRRAECVGRLLCGELVDSASLDYDLDRWHIGILGRGEKIRGTVAELASEVDASRLAISEGDDRFAVWFGWTERPDPDRLAAVLEANMPEGVRLGVGEPALGRSGWRLTHEQARASLSVSIRAYDSISRYIDVSLLAAALQNEVLSNSLQLLYLDPLGAAHSGGTVIRQTLRAYLDAEQNVTSAAARLGVSRNTVTNRVRAAEQKIGHLKPPRAAHLSLALRLEEIRSGCPIVPANP